MIWAALIAYVTLADPSPALVSQRLKVLLAVLLLSGELCA
jgi:hypothetical protein